MVTIQTCRTTSCVVFHMPCLNMPCLKVIYLTMFTKNINNIHLVMLKVTLSFQLWQSICNYAYAACFAMSLCTVQKSMSVGCDVCRTHHCAESFDMTWVHVFFWHEMHAWCIDLLHKPQQMCNTWAPFQAHTIIVDKNVYILWNIRWRHMVQIALLVMLIYIPTPLCDNDHIRLSLTGRNSLMSLEQSCVWCP